MIDPTIELLGHVRRAKTEAKVSQRAGVASLQVGAPAGIHAALSAGRADLLDAGSILQLTVADADVLGCAVELAPST